MSSCHRLCFPRRSSGLLSIQPISFSISSLVHGTIGPRGAAGPPLEPRGARGAREAGAREAGGARGATIRIGVVYHGTSENDTLCH